MNSRPNISFFFGIEGSGEFTMDKFKGIKIEATGQNIVTVGDGNQVNAQYKDAAGALVDLKQALLQSPSLNEAQKLDVVADIDRSPSRIVPSSKVQGRPLRSWTLCWDSPTRHTTHLTKRCS